MTNKTPSPQRRYGQRLVPDYTEDIVGFALESFLAVMSFPHYRYTIEPFSRNKERWLGADARLHSRISGFRPFYMQFKRPCAYPDYSNATIISDRKRLNLQVSPRVLYFDLRTKKQDHWDFQHNVLFRLRRRLRQKGIGDAAYVCPLFLDRAAYRFNMHLSALRLWLHFWRRNPWKLEEVLLNNGNNKIHFNRVPIFAEHITVPPHAAVTSAKHRYSFTESGTELCFHSPEALPDGTMNLVEFLSGVLEGFPKESKKIKLEDANNKLKELMDAAEAGKPDELNFEDKEDDPIENWFAWGDHLQRHYQIYQYALVSWED